MDVPKDISVRDAGGNTVCAQYWTDAGNVYLSTPDGEVMMLRQSALGSEPTARIMLRQWMHDHRT
jgi:hypothetical protein